MHHQQNISKLLVTELATKVGVLYLFFIYFCFCCLVVLWSSLVPCHGDSHNSLISWYCVLPLFWPENHQELGNEVRSRECPVGFEQAISQFHCNALTHCAILLKILLKALCLNRGMLFCWRKGWSVWKQRNNFCSNSFPVFILFIFIKWICLCFCVLIITFNLFVGRIILIL